MNILKFILLVATATFAHTLFAGDVEVIYIRSGDAAQDAACIAGLQSNFQNTATSNYYISVVDSRAQANDLADYAHNEEGDKSLITLHGLDDGDPSIDTVHTKSDGDFFVLDPKGMFDSDEVYYCYQGEDGGYINSGDIRSMWDSDQGE